MSANAIKTTLLYFMICSLLFACTKTTQQSEATPNGNQGTAASPQNSQGPKNQALVDGSLKTSSIPSQMPKNASGTWTIDAAVQQAVRWHPAVTERVGHMLEQETRIIEARSGYLPSVSWGADGVTQNNSNSSFNPNLNVGVSQMLYDFGKVDSRVKIATAGTTARRSEVLVAVDDLARETSTAYIELSRNQALAKVAADQIKDTQDIARLVTSRREKGASTQSDVYQADSRVQAAKATMTEISGERARWTSALSNLTGQSSFKLSNKFPKYLYNACQQSNVEWEKLPSVMKTDADEEAAKSQITLAKAEGLPTLSLEVGANADPFGTNHSDLNYSLGLKVKGSLYNGGATIARHKMAEQSLASLQATRERIKLGISRNLNDAASQIASKKTLAQSLEHRKEIMQLTLMLYQKQYLELGTRTLLDVLNAAQEMHAARFDQVNIQFDLLRLNLDCLYNTGKSRDVFELQGLSIQGIQI